MAEFVRSLTLNWNHADNLARVGFSLMRNPFVLRPAVLGLRHSAVVFTLVNHHHLSEPIPQSAYAALTTRFAEMCELGLRTFQIIEVADGEVILVAVFDSAEARKPSAN